MGGDASKPGGIKIILEKHVFCPGEVIRGSINCVIHRSLPACSLLLSFKGQEEVSWYERQAKIKKYKTSRSRHSSRVTYETVHYYNKRTISKTHYSIMECRDALSPGSYSVPFTFSLPNSLPSSFHYLEQSLNFSVIYKIYARLRTAQTKIGDKQEIRIYSHYDVPRPVERPISANLISWCCFPKGSVTLSVDWRNDKYTPDSPVQCTLNIDNSNSSGYIMEVKASGYYVIHAQAQKRKTIKNEVFKSIYPVQVRPGSKMLGGDGQSFSFDLKQSHKQLDVMNVHSMKGTILECSFYIEFEMAYDFKCLCCGDTPKINTLFFVRPNTVFTVPQFVPPTQWSPYMFNPVNVSYQPAYEVSDKGDGQMCADSGQYNGGNITTVI